MAILHRATLTPTEPELIAAWLDRQSWGGAGEIEVVGSYRFDDPAGEVGVEAVIVRRGGTLLQVPMTYRGGPLEGAEAHLIGTMDHSALGKRWIYEGGHDPVAVGCFARALAGEQQQASLEVFEGDRFVGRRDPDVRIERRVDGPSSPDVSASGDLRIATVLGGEAGGRERLVATWAGGDAVVAVR